MYDVDCYDTYNVEQIEKFKKLNFKTEGGGGVFYNKLLNKLLYMLNIGVYLTCIQLLKLTNSEMEYLLVFGYV